MPILPNFESVFRKLVIRSTCCSGNVDDDKCDHVKERLVRLEVELNRCLKDQKAELKRCIKEQKHMLQALEKLIQDVHGVDAALLRERNESSSTNSSPPRTGTTDLVRQSRPSHTQK